MFFGLNLSVFLPGLILFIACIDDLRSRKIHNKLILILLPLVLLAVFFLQGLEGLRIGGFSALLALLIAVPLTLARFIGGGDLKLLILLALSVHWSVFIHILIYSLFWAVALGLVKITLDGKLKEFFFNVFFLFRYRKTEGLKLHSIPFSIALFMAWLSFFTLQRANFKAFDLFPM